jgi:hypothetical protein
MEENTRRLLEKTPWAWGEFGASGWRGDGTESIFQSSSSVHHTTSYGTSDSWSRLANYYTPELEAAVEAKYATEYDIANFQLPRRKIEFGIKSKKNKLRRIQP